MSTMATILGLQVRVFVQCSFLGPLEPISSVANWSMYFVLPSAGGSGFGGHDKHPLPFLLVCNLVEKPLPCDLWERLGEKIAQVGEHPSLATRMVLDATDSLHQS